ncbi:hypothetical protein KC343_g10340 [Hortaea werneckii]|nr:hypothetical protein KC352_g19557 [Hortaea werneckii]KAI7558999.1 hypothetical protein KC317_g10647 [Hortaea werneckii]KAI7606990.1 hypothetical protein KC346_g10270 [Hortaea werneckii]KAI7614849.1 hypothetical protein KC343_g10340 [Hortaea werneckii]KAI7654688.1 hypothetical protein KC319_g10199 [Hortaea werneckii]
MPTYRSITLALQSQYDALTIPEAALPSAMPVPQDDLVDFAGGGVPTDRFLVEESCTDSRVIGTTYYLDPTSRTAEVSIPIYASSQFWIVYACPRPLPGTRQEEEEDGMQVRYYFFKLLVRGQCIVSWGCGEQQGWQGKTMFGLFTSGSDFERRRVVEKMGFFFPSYFSEADDGSESADTAAFEVQVFRSWARRRERTGMSGMLSNVEVEGKLGNCLGMHPLGILKKGEPNRRYTYALIDAVDEPYATFKYHFEPEDLEDGDALSPSLSTTALCGFPIEDQRLYPNTNNASATSKRLSFPPKVRLVPSTTQHEPFAPIKKPDPENEGGRLARQSARRNRYSVARDGRRSVDAIDFVTEDDTVLERPASSQSERRRETSVNLLQSVISNAMRRKDGRRRGDEIRY